MNSYGEKTKAMMKTESRPLLINRARFVGQRASELGKPRDSCAILAKLDLKILSKLDS